MEPRRAHRVAVAQAIFVTFLWSTSWVLIKLGLEEMPALTFAGTRYLLAFVVLAAALVSRRSLRAALARLTRRDWLILALLGLVFYTFTQGAQFVALAYLPAISLSLTLSFTPGLVALAAIPLLGERPTRLQWLGLALFFVGIYVYFAPLRAPSTLAGALAAAVALIANSAGSMLGRRVNRDARYHPLLVTVVSMGIGSAVLLAAGLVIEAPPRFSATGWLLILWLAVVNTALAFTLWNHTLRRLTAMESSLVNNTMLIQIALLAWLFLGEPLGGREILGILLAGGGIVAVQLRPPTRAAA